MSNTGDSPPRPFAWLADEESPDLSRLMAEVCDALQTAADKAAHGFHLPVLATYDAALERPACRTVVLRTFDEDAMAVQCHTDVRTPKVAHLRETPAASWTFYDRDARVQLVAEGRTTVHTGDAVAEVAWDASRLESLRCYLAPKPPGESMTARAYNLPPDLVDEVPTANEARAGRKNFAVIRTELEVLELLLLKHQGNLRVMFRRDADGWSQSWVAA